jgi:type II secretory pathway component PulF
MIKKNFSQFFHNINLYFKYLVIAFLLFVLHLLLFKYLPLSEGIYSRFSGNVPTATIFVLNMATFIQTYTAVCSIIYLLFVSGVVYILFKYKKSAHLVQIFISLLIATIMILAYLPIFQMGASIG